MDNHKRQNLLRSFYCGFVGLGRMIKEERNIKIHLLVSFLTVLAGIYFRISPVEWAIVVLTIFSIFCAEMFNSAVEQLANVVRDENHLGYQATRLARDIACGAVLTLSVGAVILGLIIFLPKVFSGII